MKALKLISRLLAFLIVAPIWYWLIYQILVRVQASELMLFLFWVYVPCAVLAQVLAKIAESAGK